MVESWETSDQKRNTDLLVEAIGEDSLWAAAGAVRKTWNPSAAQLSACVVQDDSLGRASPLVAIAKNSDADTGLPLRLCEVDITALDVSTQQFDR